MCLAVPAKLVECEGDRGVADLHGNRVPVQTLFAPEAKAGDWVLVHAGFVIKRLEAKDAEATWSVLDDLTRRVEGGGHEPR